ncbi:hypothetical protein LCGC14_2685850 [marine sediment metagenome]|uniref:Aminoglycoside phosphotransferase domain-containing protein n=1 Tax=marine sediment metagenome TaxID=412755 RepID=A0A0F8ZK02_9ZZZZ
MSANWEDYNKAFLTDCLRFILGQRLGNGVSREVYVYRGNSAFVIKVETEATEMFQNVMEYKFWQDAQGCKEIMKWLAPCCRISPHGNYMIQERTMPVSLAELRRKYKRVPIFLSDLKDTNWGRLPNGRIVCHDYGTHLAASSMRTATRKADWWD